MNKHDRMMSRYFTEPDEDDAPRRSVWFLFGYLAGIVVATLFFLLAGNSIQSTIKTWLADECTARVVREFDNEAEAERGARWRALNTPFDWDLYRQVIIAIKTARQCKVP